MEKNLDINRPYEVEEVKGYYDQLDDESLVDLRHQLISEIDYYMRELLAIEDELSVRRQIADMYDNS